MDGCQVPFVFPFLPEPPIVFPPLELFAYAPGNLVDQGGWMATTDPSILVLAPGQVSSTGVEFEGASNDHAIPAGIPFDAPWEISVDIFNAAGIGYYYVAFQIRTGIIGITSVIQINTGTLADYAMWNSSITGTHAVAPGAVHRFTLRYAAGTSTFLIDGVSIATQAQSPGSDVPDTFRLYIEGSNPCYVSRLAYGPP